jgi:hypothetical protein
MGTNDTMNVLYLPRLFTPKPQKQNPGDVHFFVFQGGEVAAIDLDGNELKTSPPLRQG